MRERGRLCYYSTIIAFVRVGMGCRVLGETRVRFGATSESPLGEQKPQLADTLTSSLQGLNVDIFTRYSTDDGDRRISSDVSGTAHHHALQIYNFTN